VITPKTVAKHIEHILTKLPARNRAEAVGIAYRRGPRSGGAWDWLRARAAVSGHSKWAGIKYRMKKLDAKRRELFTKLARAIHRRSA
jgi:DNA-binding CsgD family transcriptional regulator